MKVLNCELDILGLRRLVRGSVPNRSVLRNPIVKQCSWYNKDEIRLWSHLELNKLSEEELWDLYCICRDSWPPSPDSWDSEGRGLSAYWDSIKKK
jgi:hypothetical protein